MKQRELMKNLSTLFRHRRRAIRKQLDKYDIGTGEWSILALLSHRSGGMEQSEIGQYLGLEKTTMARELKSLEKNGYIMRKQDKGDRRKKIVYLSERADEIIPRIKDMGNRWLKSVVEGISETDMKVFFGILARMTENSDKHIEGVEGYE